MSEGNIWEGWPKKEMSSAISLANWSFQFLSTVYGQTSDTWVGLKIVYTPFQISSGNLT